MRHWNKLKEINPHDGNLICFTDSSRLEPPSYYSHSNAETAQSGNLCETGRPVISQAEPES